MNDLVKEIFKRLGVEPNEEFKVDGYGDIIFSIDNDLVLTEYDSKVNLHLFKFLLLHPENIIKIPKKKHVGDLKCNAFKDCEKCHLRGIHCTVNNKLYDVLEDWFEEYKDEEIYAILKSRLDKEVEE